MGYREINIHLIFTTFILNVSQKILNWANFMYLHFLEWKNKLFEHILNIKAKYFKGVERPKTNEQKLPFRDYFLMLNVKYSTPPTF